MIVQSTLLVGFLFFVHTHRICDSPGSFGSEWWCPFSVNTIDNAPGDVLSLQWLRLVKTEHRVKWHWNRNRPELGTAAGQHSYPLVCGASIMGPFLLGVQTWRDPHTCSSTVSFFFILGQSLVAWFVRCCCWRANVYPTMGRLPIPAVAVEEMWPGLRGS